MTVSLEGMAVKAKCKTIAGTKTYTVWQAHAHCSISDLNGNASLNQCAGTCSSGNPLAAIEGLQIASLHLSAKSLKCDVSQAIPTGFTTLISLIVPALKNQVIKALTPPIQNALNGMIPAYVPFPGTCN